MSLNRDAVLAKLNVSRETSDRLDIYAALLIKWNRVINLVAPGSISELWSRHFLDSAQLLSLSPTKGRWLDIGSGGGFPGLICGIIASEKKPDLRFGLVEADQRKCAFLSTVLRETGLQADIHTSRIEDLSYQSVNILTARALAPLSGLLEFAERHLASNGVGFFMKGAQFDVELRKALESWHFDVQKHSSKTDPSAAILEIGNITRV